MLYTDQAVNCGLSGAGVGVTSGGMVDVVRVRRWVQIITLAASCYNMGTIWMTQVGWRLFAYVGRDDFPAYHRAWWFGRRGIQPVVFPAGILATLGSFAQLRWGAPRTPAWQVRLGVGLLVTAWASTAAWWGRLQGQLEEVRREDGTLHPLYRRLLATHWLRVALFTAAALLQVAMAAVDTRELLPPDGEALTTTAVAETTPIAGRA